MISAVSHTSFKNEQFIGVFKKNDAFKSETPEERRKTDSEQKEIDALKRRDREVRAHEAAHAAAAGGLARGMSFSFKKGPDGQQYAVGGEVQIDTSPVKGDPQATILKMQQVRRSALAPGDPSGQDRAVAAQAANIQAKASREAFKSGNENDSGEVLKGDVPEGEKSFKKEFLKVKFSGTLSVYTHSELANATMKLSCSMCGGSSCYHAA